MKTLIITLCIAGLLPFALAEDTTPKLVNPADAKTHIGDTATVCGKVVGSTVSKYGIAGRGKPVSFYLDEKEPNPVFYFVAFGTKPDGPQEAIDAYNGKQVCVTGKIELMPSGGVPFIMAKDRSQVKPQADAKPQGEAK